MRRVTPRQRPRFLRPMIGLWVRAADVKDFFDAFLITAVSTVVVVRLFLVITGYPKLGGKGFHIAHLLWGGLLMVVALVIVTGLITRAARRVAAVVGGIGFGLFIDEMGKFVTADNNYFYRPTYSLIYIVLVVIWVATRQLFVVHALTHREALANAVEELKEGTIRHLSERERRRAVGLAERALHSHSVAEHVLELLRKLETMEAEPPHALARLLHRITAFYWTLCARKGFATVVGVVFAALAGIELYRAQDLARTAIDAFGRNGATLSSVERAVNGADLGFAGWATLASSAIVAGMFLVGIVALFRHSLLNALWWLEHGLLVSIFVAQVFDFATLHLFAFAVLGLNLILFATVRFMLNQEEHRHGRPATPRPIRAGAVTAELS
jgi:hypothetical protein